MVTASVSYGYSLVSYSYSLGLLRLQVRGRLLTAALLLYAAAGLPAGYAAARLYRQMHGRQMYELITLQVPPSPGLASGAGGVGGAGGASTVRAR